MFTGNLQQYAAEVDRRGLPPSRWSPKIDPDALRAEIHRQRSLREQREKRRGTPVNGAKERRERLETLRRWRASRDAAPVWTALPEDGYWRLGRYSIWVRRTKYFDYHRYSAAWHRQYGPSVTIKTDAVVRWEERCRLCAHRIDLPRLTSAPGAIMEFIATHAGIKPQRGQRALRIHPAVTLREIQAGLYARILLGD